MPSSRRLVVSARYTDVLRTMSGMQFDCMLINTKKECFDVKYY